jgi:hypothetical protein
MTIWLSEPWRETVFCPEHDEIEHAAIDRDGAHTYEEAAPHALLATATLRCGHKTKIVTTGDGA